MSSDQGAYSKGFMLGTVVGGAVGALLALLFAPKSGRDFRRDIADKSEEIVDKASEFFSQTEQQSEDVVNEGKIRAERIVNSARAKAESLLSNAEQVLHDARIRAQSIKEGVQSGVAKVGDAAKAGAEAFRSELD
ncbi:MAG: YtxH domain-containing protein [Ignavibacteria bacterium]|nr:YtxH domain-containing protein [Ignavibacteria bacterium]